MKIERDSPIAEDIETRDQSDHVSVYLILH